MVNKASNNCIFCKIVRGEIPCAKVYEDEHTLAFFDINPASEFHTLVISKKHYVNMLDVPEDTASNIMRTIKKVVALFKEKLGLQDVNVINNSGIKAHQDVFTYIFTSSQDSQTLPSAHHGKDIPKCAKNLARCWRD